MVKKRNIFVLNDGRVEDDDFNPLADASETLKRIEKMNQDRKEKEILNAKETAKIADRSESDLPGGSINEQEDNEKGGSIIDRRSAKSGSGNDRRSVIDRSENDRRSVKDGSENEQGSEIEQPMQFKIDLLKNILKDSRLNPQTKVFLSYALFEMNGIEDFISMNKIAKDLELSRGTLANIRKQYHEVLDIYTDNTGTKISFFSYCSKTDLWSENDLRMLVSSFNINNKKENNIIDKKSVDNFFVKRNFNYFLRALLTLKMFRKFEIYSKVYLNFLLVEFMKIEDQQKAVEKMLAISIYANGKIKNELSSLHYLKSVIENEGFDSLQNVFNEEAKKRIIFADQLPNMHFDNPGYDDLIEYCKMLGIDYVGHRALLQARLETAREVIQETHRKLVEMI